MRRPEVGIERGVRVVEPEAPHLGADAVRDVLVVPAGSIAEPQGQNAGVLELETPVDLDVTLGDRNEGVPDQNEVAVQLSTGTSRAAPARARAGRSNPSSLNFICGPRF